MRGTWYYDSSGDSTNVDYTELYFNDSTYYPQGQRFGQWYHPNRYKLTSDSLYYEEDDKTFQPYYKIQNFRNDTLFLIADSRTRPKKNIYWVRLPKSEKGHYEHVWATSNTDSLNYIIRNDWHRRMIKYHLFLENDLKKYDSMVSAGFWNFTMKDVLEEKMK
jgi:hypothetical protein